MTRRLENGFHPLSTKTVDLFFFWLEFQEGMWRVVTVHR